MNFSYRPNLQFFQLLSSNNSCLSLTKKCNGVVPCFLTNASADPPPPPPLPAAADESPSPHFARKLEAIEPTGRESMMEKERTCCDRDHDAMRGAALFCPAAGADRSSTCPASPAGFARPSS
jgi:hypothetical protein